MRRLVNFRQRAGLLQILIILFVTAWCSSVNAAATDDFLLLDKTLLLDGGALLPVSSALSLRTDFGRGQIRALGIRQTFGREMISMGRAFGDYLGIRSARGNTFSPLLLRNARAPNLRSLGSLRTLRSNLGKRLSSLSVKKFLPVRSNQYLLGARTTTNGGQSSIWANFSILDKTLVWSVSDDSGDIFAMSKSTPVPEPGTLFLLATGLLGLIGIGFHRRRTKR